MAHGRGGTTTSRGEEKSSEISQVPVTVARYIKCWPVLVLADPGTAGHTG